MKSFFLCLLIAAAALPASAQDRWWLRLESVRVEQQREPGGDRPYFAMITFQSRINMHAVPRDERHPTRVELYEREPHDWVSKPEYHAGRRLRQGDHLSNGESLPIPPWMGIHVYEPVEMASLAGGTALTAPILGAIVVALDNNNTPPHAVRNALETIRDWTERYLQEEVETGRIIGVLRSEDPAAAFSDSFEEFVREAIRDLNVGRVVETAFGVAVGSLGNPDKLVGLHAFVFPAIEEIPRRDSTGTFSAPIVGENVTWGYHLAPLGGLSRTFSFVGSDARYSVPVRLSNAAVPGTAMVNRLTLRIRTGEDDLRSGSRARAVVIDGHGVPVGEADLNGGESWAGRSDHTVTIPLRRPMPASEMDRLQLQFTPGSSGPFDTGDNWNVDMVTVSTDPAAPPLASVQGRPLVRFTGSQRTHDVRLRTAASATAPSSPEDPRFPPSDRTTLEREFDRPGSDYRRFVVEGNYRVGCQRICEQDTRCQAWTYVRSTNTCWLKDGLPAKVRNADTISGIRLSLISTDLGR